MEGTSISAMNNSCATECSGSQDKRSLPLSNLSNDSRELKTNSSKGRVVSSKFKSAAVEVARKGKLAMVNSNPTSSRSNSCDAKSLDKSSVRPKKWPPQKRSIHSSSASLSKPNYLSNKQLPKILLREAENQKNRDDIKPNSKLHSTAVNNSTFFDKTICGSDMFSTTVVGGKLQINFPSLAELPDISTISPINVNPSESSFGSLTEELPSSNEPLENDASTKLVDEQSDYSQEEITAEYLRYLTWALVDIDSEDKYHQQMSEAEKQIAFLTNLVKDQQDRLLDNQKSLALIDHYEKICKEHQVQKELLQKFEGSVEPCENHLDSLTSNLAMQISKIRLENVYIPTDNKNFQDELKSTLDENCNLLSKINSYLEPERIQNEALAALSNDISVCIDTARPCLNEIEKLASIAIQETSLAFTMDKIVGNVAGDGE